MNTKFKFSENLSRRSFLGGLAAAGAATAITGSPSQAQAATAKRKVCIFSKHLQFLDYDEMAETVAEIGFDGVDIPVRPGGHVLPERVLDDLPRAVEAVKKAGLSVEMITTAITSPDSPHAENVLKTASDLGIKYYRLGYFKYDDAKGVIEILDECKPKLKDLADMNRQFKMHGGYQNHAGYGNIGSTIWDIWYMVRELDPRWIGCQFDIRHATVEGGKSWYIDMKLISKFAKTTVIKDFKWGIVDGKWDVINTHIGEGMIDFKAYYEQIKKLNISGPISTHHEYPHGRTKEEAVPLFKKDLTALRGYLKDAGL